MQFGKLNKKNNNMKNLQLQYCGNVKRRFLLLYNKYTKIIINKFENLKIENKFTIFYSQCRNSFLYAFLFICVDKLRCLVQYLVSSKMLCKN